MKFHKGIAPRDWPEGWLASILSAIAAQKGKYKHATHADFWRAYVLVSRDTDWPFGFLRALRFDQIAPDGTIVYRHPGNPGPLVARLTKEALDAIEPLRQSPHPSGKIFVQETTDWNFVAKWRRIVRTAGFDRKTEAFPAANRHSVADTKTISVVPPPPIASEAQSVAQFLQHTYAPLRLGGKSPRTLAIYEISIRKFSKFLCRDAMLSDFCDDTVAKYLAHVRERGNAPATVLREYTSLTALWNFACRRHYVRDYPTIAKPKAPRADPQGWLASDVQKLFNRISELDGWIAGVRESAWWLALHYLIWNSGERITAVLALQWDDIDLAGKWVTIRAAYRKGRGEDKTHALADYTVAALEAIKLPQRAEVFPWPHDRSYIWTKYAARILKPAGLPSDRRSKFHRMRRTVASYFEALGGNATDLLGHFDRRVTEDHYLDGLLKTWLRAGVIRLRKMFLVVAVRRAKYLLNGSPSERK